MYLPRVNWLKLDCLKERLAARWNHFFYWLHTADSRRGPETQNNQQAVAQNHGKETFKPFWCGFGGLHENKIYSVNFWDNKSLWRITLLKRRQVPKRWKSCAKTLRKPFNSRYQSIFPTLHLGRANLITKFKYLQRQAEKNSQKQRKTKLLTDASVHMLTSASFPRHISPFLGGEAKRYSQNSQETCIA